MASSSIPREHAAVSLPTPPHSRTPSVCDVFDAYPLPFNAPPEMLIAQAAHAASYTHYGAFAPGYVVEQKAWPGRSDDVFATGCEKAWPDFESASGYATSSCTASPERSPSRVHTALPKDTTHEPLSLPPLSELLPTFGPYAPSASTASLPPPHTPRAHAISSLTRALAAAHQAVCILARLGPRVRGDADGPLDDASVGVICARYDVWGAGACPALERAEFVDDRSAPLWMHALARARVKVDVLQDAIERARAGVDEAEWKEYGMHA